MSHISGTHHTIHIMPRLSEDLIGRARTRQDIVSIVRRRVDKSVIVKFLIGSNKHSKNLIVLISLIRTDSDYGRPTVRRRPRTHFVLVRPRIRF